MKKIKLLLFIIGINLSGFSQSRDSIPNTIITPHLYGKIDNINNLIYCSTFQIAWNELKKNIGDDIILNEELELVNFLNKDVHCKKNINRNDYYVISKVLTQDVLDKVNNDLSKKFKGEFSPITTIDNDESFSIYSYILKNIEFKIPFEDINSKKYFINKNLTENNKYKFFGINLISYDKDSKDDEVNNNRKKLLKQIKPYFFENNDTEYIVKIKSKSKQDEIILALVKPKRILKETIMDVMNKINKYKKPKNIKYKISGLSIPEIGFDYEYEFSELIGTIIQNSPYSNFSIDNAIQFTKFSLDKNGSKLKSHSKLEGSCGLGSTGKDKVKYIWLNFDRPFLLLLKEKNKDFPYFAIWINNGSILK